MWIFTRPPDQLQESDLRGLIRDSVQESLTLEFKRDMYGGSEGEIRKMLRDVASLANANGGILIIGMAEDGEATAADLVPVPNAEVEAQRLVASCASNIAERIPGLRAPRVPIQDGDAIVVWVPRSYRKPHMITFKGAPDFWIRHDRQNVRMSIAEIRTAVTTTEDVAMKAEAFIAARRERLRVRTADLLLALTATPLSLEDGRVEISDPRLTHLLRHPPTLREEGVGIAVSSENARLTPTVNGLKAEGRTSGLPPTLEIFRNGYVEFVVWNGNMLIALTQMGTPQIGPPQLLGWAVAEATRNFTYFVRDFRDVLEISDPYLVGLSLWRCQGMGLHLAGGSASVFDDDPDLTIGPIIFPLDTSPDSVTREISDRLWNAFHAAKCPHFDAEGRFNLPSR